MNKMLATILAFILNLLFLLILHITGWMYHVVFWIIVVCGIIGGAIGVVGFASLMYFSIEKLCLFLLNEKEQKD